MDPNKSVLSSIKNNQDANCGLLWEGTLRRKNKDELQK